MELDLSFTLLLKIVDDLEDIQKSAEAAQKKFDSAQLITGPEFTMSQNYPNPAKAKTSIQFNVPLDGFASLEIYDYLGKKVEDVFSKELTKGEHITELDLQKYRPGIYFYKAIFLGKEIIRKMMVLE